MFLYVCFSLIKIKPKNYFCKILLIELLSFLSGSVMSSWSSVNCSTTMLKEFILFGITDCSDLQIPLFVVFLLNYKITQKPGDHHFNNAHIFLLCICSTVGLLYNFCDHITFSSVVNGLWSLCCSLQSTALLDSHVPQSLHYVGCSILYVQLLCHLALNKYISFFLLIC